MACLWVARAEPEALRLQAPSEFWGLGLGQSYPPVKPGQEGGEVGG